MANTSVATRWLLSKKDSLKVSFLEHKGDLSFFSNLTDIEVKIHLNSGHIISGRGTSNSDDLALEKASSEAIERWCCYKLSVSTVGSAVHSIANDAEINSRNEFLERNYFDQFMAGKISPTNIFNETVKEYGDKMIEYYPNSSIKFFEITKYENYHAIICLILDDQTPIALGLSHEENIYYAIQKSFIEAIRNFTVYKNDQPSFLSAVSKDKNLWCCNTEYLKLVFNRITTPPREAQLISPHKHFTITRKVSSILEFEDCSLFFSQTYPGESL